MTTEAGRILLDAFRTEPADPNFAVRISAESIIRHAIPKIEADAVAAERGRIKAAVEGLVQHWSEDYSPDEMPTNRNSLVVRAAVLLIIEEATP